MIAILALIWPSRLSGPLDGAPLDTLAEVLLLGLLAPVLAWLHPSFLRSAAARVIVVAILALKIAAAVTLQQQGWCLSFTPAKPMVRESTGKPHSWDIRADWLADDPVCSAVMSRSYRDTFSLPVWFFNLPPPDDAPHRAGYGAGEIPVRVDLFGFIDVRDEGALDIVTGAGMGASLRIDGGRVDPLEPGHHQVALSPGTHGVQVEAMLASKHWPIVPAWNGQAMESMRFPPTTIKPPSWFDRASRPIGNWLQWLLCGGLVMSWTVSFARRMGDRALLTWSVAAALAVSVAATRLASEAAWYTAAVLTLPLLLFTRSRFQNARGAFLLIGVPWLAYFAAANLHQVGRWTLYGVGNDNFLFQRYSYRVFMQHFWLEGGQVTFWNQPFYRWIAGTLHMIFGDSSLGQVYLDAAGIAVMALFAFKVVAERSTFTIGLVAAIIPMAMFLLGPTLEFVGFGLSEIASASCIYLAAFFAMRNRRAGDVVMAGVLVMVGVLHPAQQPADGRCRGRVCAAGDTPGRRHVAAAAMVAARAVAGRDRHRRRARDWRRAVCLAHLVLHRRVRRLSRHAARVPGGVETRDVGDGGDPRDDQQPDDGADGKRSTAVCLARVAAPRGRR